MPYYLGIDGGQSSTEALIADETGLILGRGSAGPCNHVSAEEAAAKFKTVIGGCIAQACGGAGLDPETIEFSAACLGFSGGAEDKQIYARALIRSKHFKITHDAEIALTGATAGAPGVIVIAGTGSIAFGRNDAGIAARAGGWGYIYGDEGGAFDIVRRALRAALQFEEGWGPATALGEILLAATNSPSANSLMHRFYTPEFPRSRVASLAPLVDRAASSGDHVAIGILDEAAVELARLVEAVHRNLFPSHQHAIVSYIGGVFRSDSLRTRFSQHVLRATGRVANAPQFGPAAGAVLEALRLDGIPASISGLPKIKSA